MKIGKSCKKVIRNIIIGENRYIDSFTEYKQVMLSGSFAMIAMAVLVVNSLLEETLSVALLAYSISFVLLGFSVILHRMGKHMVANYFMLITSYFTIYLFVTSESTRTGIFCYFIVITIGAFAVFNHAYSRLHAVFFSLLAFVLMCLTVFFDFSILPWRDYSPEKEILTGVVNFGASLAAAGMAVSLLIKMNQESAKRLSENNKLLIKTNSELDRFVYSTSHDLRAPLTSLMGLINIATNVEDIAELKRYLTLMKGRVDSLDHFIKDITDYSRNNRKEIVVDKVNVKELAMEVWEDLRFTPEAANIHFEVLIDNEAEVVSDKNRLKVILSNLLSNAVRYHDQRKEKQYIRLFYRCTDLGFNLHVEDNGQGIAEEYHQKIFEMFYRGNESSKGSGLGLYIVKETLEKLSGSISLESKPGSGSSFKLSFPASCR